MEQGPCTALHRIVTVVRDHSFKSQGLTVKETHHLRGGRGPAASTHSCPAPNSSSGMAEKSALCMPRRCNNHSAELVVPLSALSGTTARLLAGGCKDPAQTQPNTWEGDTPWAIGKQARPQILMGWKVTGPSFVTDHE